MNVKPIKMHFIESIKAALPWIAFTLAVGGVAYGFLWSFRKLKSGTSRLKDKIIKGVATLEENEILEPGGIGFSFPYGIPLVVYPIFFFGAYKGREACWGYSFHTPFFLLVALFFFMGLSRREFEKIHKNHQELNRSTWMLNNVLFFVVIPVIFWILIFLPVLIK